MATESPDSVWTELTRRRVSGHLSAVRRRRPLLLAPTSSTSRHAPDGRLRRAIPSSGAPHFASPSPRWAPPRSGELFRPLHRVSGQASPPRAPPRCPLPRCPSLSLSRELVRPHCQLRRELHLAGVRRGHRWRGQASLLHHFSPFLFLALPLDSLMLGVNLNWDGISSARRRTARSTAEPPFTPASPLELGRVRVSHLGRSAFVRGSRWCPWIRPRPHRRRVSPATSSPLSLCHCRAGPADHWVSVSASLSPLVHCLADPVLFLKNS